MLDLDEEPTRRKLLSTSACRFCPPLCKSPSVPKGRWWELTTGILKIFNTVRYTLSFPLFYYSITVLSILVIFLVLWVQPGHIVSLPTGVHPRMEPFKNWKENLSLSWFLQVDPGRIHGGRLNVLSVNNQAGRWRTGVPESCKRFWWKFKIRRGIPTTFPVIHVTDLQPALLARPLSRLAGLFAERLGDLTFCFIECFVREQQVGRKQLARIQIR